MILILDRIWVNYEIKHSSQTRQRIYRLWLHDEVRFCPGITITLLCEKNWTERELWLLSLTFPALSWSRHITSVTCRAEPRLRFTRCHKNPSLQSWLPHWPLIGQQLKWQPLIGWWWGETTQGPEARFSWANNFDQKCFPMKMVNLCIDSEMKIELCHTSQHEHDF